jgi:hypothetical protein
MTSVYMPTKSATMTGNSDHHAPARLGSKQLDDLGQDLGDPLGDVAEYGHEFAGHPFPHGGMALGEGVDHARSVEHPIGVRLPEVELVLAVARPA